MTIWEQTLVGALEQLGCWLTPACQARQAAELLHHFVVCPPIDVLSVEQKRRLGFLSAETVGWSFVFALTLGFQSCQHNENNNAFKLMCSPFFPLFALCTPLSFILTESGAWEDSLTVAFVPPL